MTFRIFSDDARKTIADHIIGAPPAIPNRYGENHGTDLLVQGGDSQPLPYDSNPSGRYLPGGSYAPGGPSNTETPPSHTPGQTAQIECSGGFPADHAGKCPESMFEKNGKLFAFNRQLDANGLAYCCPTEVPTLNQSQQKPPQNVSVNSCPPEFTQTLVTFNPSKYHTPIQAQPFGGKTPAQLESELKKQARDLGGTFKKQQIDAGRANFIMCVPSLLPQTTVPPIRIPAPTETQTQEYDGDTNQSTPSSPESTQIVFRARPLQDIAGGAAGWCSVENSLILPSDNCTKISVATQTTAKSTTALPTDCTKAVDDLVFARNPGASTVERGTPVVAVKDFTGTSGNITRATIVVVPCPST